MNRRLLFALALATLIGSNAAAQATNFRDSAMAINSAIRANHYHRDELDSERYRQIEREVLSLGEKATSADEFMNGFNALWRNGMQPVFRGPVFVLTSGRSLSAAEIAADALKAIGRATIVGEKTPGVVLSSKLFDIPGGFHLRVPIADYYSIRNGRLEGTGVSPDIPVSADQALEIALASP
jgi:hypothetical protein